MIKTELLEGILRDLKSFSNEIRQEKSKTYFPTTMKVFGVSTPEMRKVIEKWWPWVKELDELQQLELAQMLVDSRVFECQSVAYELIRKSRSVIKRVGLAEAEALGRNIDNWGTTDVFSVFVAGQAWKSGLIGDEEIMTWLYKGNRWWRRAAIVSTVALNQKSGGSKGDPPRTLLICEKVIDDRDDMVVKALSWALRELSKRDSRVVTGFMDRYQGRLAARVIREVNNKLESGRKNR